MSGLEWCGIVIDEYNGFYLCKKEDMDGNVLGYYVTCRKHRTAMDVTLEKGKMIDSTLEFCEDCRNGKPEKGLSDMAKVLLEAQRRGR